jgi:hypothetical protein
VKWSLAYLYSKFAIKRFMVKTLILRGYYLLTRLYITGSLQRHMQQLVSIVVEKKKPKNHFFKY